MKNYLIFLLLAFSLVSNAQEGGEGITTQKLKEVLDDAYIDVRYNVLCNCKNKNSEFIK